jgi:tRNA 2-selenouridine synthase
MIKDISASAILAKAARTLDFDEAAAAGHQLVDVRSSAEFLAGSLPGAVNIPLFDEDERSVIGTIYRHGGHEQAVERGFSYAGQKISALLGCFEPYRDKTLAICCARGGMRSLSVVNLLLQAGFSAVQLDGGYKKYRNDVLLRLEDFQPRLIVIHGLTGTGKTRLLQLLDPAIDLEGLANHRSSLFGGIDREPCNQRTFESRLAQLIPTLGHEPYFIEGESRKIGRVFIPKPLAMAMKQAVLVNIHCSLETRIERIIEDYPVTDARTLADIETILKSLRQNMGESRVEEMCGLLRNGELRELVRILLLDYYDKRYGKSMREYRYSLEISAEDLAGAAAVLTEFRRSLNKKQ